MKTILTYTHIRNLFRGTKFKPFVNKYFKDVKYLGTECGNWEPSISISNWEDVKYQLPKYAIPVKIEWDYNHIHPLSAIASGQLHIARTFYENQNTL